jgi:hypothetical protein
MAITWQRRLRRSEGTTVPLTPRPHHVGYGRDTAAVSTRPTTVIRSVLFTIAFWKVGCATRKMMGHILLLDNNAVRRIEADRINDRLGRNLRMMDADSGRRL